MGGQETSSFLFGDQEYTNITICDSKTTAPMLLVAKKIQILLLVMIREHQHKLVMLHAVRTN
jgi:hypothetical protein